MATKRKPPAFYAGTLRTLWVIAVLFAAFGAVGWLATFWEVNRFLAVGMGLVFLGVPLAAAAVTGPLVNSKSLGVSLVLSLAVTGLALVDAAGNTRAFWQFETIYGQDEVNAFNAKVNADTADAKARLGAANTALAGIALTSRDCWCPETRKADLKAFEALRAPHLADKERAQDDLRAIDARKAPSPSLLPKEVSAGVALVISLALILAFLGTHYVAKREREEWEAAEEAKRKARRKSASTRKSRKAAPKRAQAEPVFTPRVVANDVT